MNTGTPFACKSSWCIRHWWCRFSSEDVSSARWVNIKWQNQGLYEIKVLWERGNEGRDNSRNPKRKPKAMADDSHSMVSTVSTIKRMSKLENSRWRVVLQRMFFPIPLLFLLVIQEFSVLTSANLGKIICIRFVLWPCIYRHQDA